MKFEIKKGLFFNALGMASKSKKSLLYVALVDALFLAALFVFQKIFSVISYAVAGRQMFSLILPLALIYYLALLFIYSISKYLVLNLIESSFAKNKLDFSRIGRFYFLNIMLFVLLLLAFFLLSFIAASVKEEIAPYVSLLILLVYFMFAYAAVNIAQILFYEGKNIINSLIISIKSLAKIRRYYGTYLVILAAFAAIFVLFGIFGSLLKLTLFQDYSSLLKYGDMYTIIFVHAAGIVFYIAVFFNRHYFYSIVKEKFLK